MFIQFYIHLTILFYFLFNLIFLHFFFYIFCLYLYLYIILHYFTCIFNLILDFYIRAAMPLYRHLYRKRKIAGYFMYLCFIRSHGFIFSQTINVLEKVLGHQSPLYSWKEPILILQTPRSHHTSQASYESKPFRLQRTARHWWSI